MGGTTFEKHYRKSCLICGSLLFARPPVRPPVFCPWDCPADARPPANKNTKTLRKSAISIGHSASDPAHHSGTNHPWWSACLMPEYRCHGLHQSVQSLWMPRSPYQGAKGVALCCEVLSWVVLCYIVLCVCFCSSDARYGIELWCVMLHYVLM